MQRTYMAKPAEVERRWLVIDADGQILGRMASRVAALLLGKHKPGYTPHVNNGDHVIVVNAARVRLTGRKLDQKVYYHHTGYPGGLRAITYRHFLASQPERVVEKAIRGMLPKNSLGRAMYRKLKVYAGSQHPHQAQKPEFLSLEG